LLRVLVVLGLNAMLKFIRPSSSSSSSSHHHQPNASDSDISG